MKKRGASRAGFDSRNVKRNAASAGKDANPLNEPIEKFGALHWHVELGCGEFLVSSAAFSVSLSRLKDKRWRRRSL
ncbi:MAG: hypothetical protein WBO71_17750, partial [Thermoanaerobaculia bacterium]